MTNINLKQMLFEKRVKDIEDDIVPFGFVDDGSDYIDQIERPEWVIEFDEN